MSKRNGKVNLLMISDTMLDDASLLKDEAEVNGILTGLCGATGDHPLDGIGGDEDVLVGGEAPTAILDGDMLLEVGDELLQVKLGRVRCSRHGARGAGSGRGVVVRRLQRGGLRAVRKARLMTLEKRDFQRVVVLRNGRLEGR